MKKHAWSKFFNPWKSGGISIGGGLRGIKREDESFQEPPPERGVVITTQLENCDKNIGAGKRLKCNRYD